MTHYRRQEHEISYYCLVHLKHVPPSDAALHQQYSTHTNIESRERERCSQFDTCPPPLHAHLGLHLVGQCVILVSEANVSLGERVCAGREGLYIEGARSYQKDILYTSPSVSNTNRLTQHTHSDRKGSSHTLASLNLKYPVVNIESIVYIHLAFCVCNCKKFHFQDGN